MIRRRDWFVTPGLAGYRVMLTAGLAIAIVVEWIAVYVADRWQYSDAMPRIPGLELGVVPIAQMLILPPLILLAVSVMVKRNR